LFGEPEPVVCSFGLTRLVAQAADDVMKTGERVYNLERYYNNLAGFREGSDTLPERFLTEPSLARAARYGGEYVDLVGGGEGGVEPFVQKLRAAPVDAELNVARDLSRIV
jgi:hypothetical protein